MNIKSRVLAEHSSFNISNSRANNTFFSFLFLYFDGRICTQNRKKGKKVILMHNILGCVHLEIDSDTITNKWLVLTEIKLFSFLPRTTEWLGENCGLTFQIEYISSLFIIECCSNITFDIESLVTFFLINYLES